MGMKRNLLTENISIDLRLFCLMARKINNGNNSFELCVAFVDASAHYSEYAEYSEYRRAETCLRPRLILGDYYIQSDLWSIERTVRSHGTIIQSC